MAVYLGSNEVSMSGTVLDSQPGFMSNSKLIAEKTYSFTLADTNYSSLTPSTTSQTLTLPTTAYAPTPATTITCFRLGESYDGTIIDRENYDYVVIGNVKIVVAYTTMPSASCQINYVSTRDYQIGKYPNALNSTTGEFTGIYSNSGYLTNTATGICKNAKGSYVQSSSYGIKGGSATCSTTAGSPSASINYINLNLSGFSIQANTTYMTVENFANIDPANTTIVATWKVYEGDHNIYSELYGTSYKKASLV